MGAASLRCAVRRIAIPSDVEDEDGLLYQLCDIPKRSVAGKASSGTLGVLDDIFERGGPLIIGVGSSFVGRRDADSASSICTSAKFRTLLVDGS